MLEGLCEGVVTHLPSPLATQAEGRLIGCVAEHLEGLLGGGGGGEGKMVERDLDRLTIIIRGCAGGGGGGGQGAVEAVQRLLPLLQAVYQSFKGSPDVLEKFGKFFKYALRTGKPKEAFYPLLEVRC